ncbi:MAG: DNA-3-methyladenine glycosylase [Liquorilactobacillus nagelii]|jgi:DNA-3-methyladenine glycosylase II|uniref:DNA-3-methyladenine glycosylase II n=1 Tax=Liquorilactobacillus nagelii TaxID=82688 RepID=A0A3Q8CHI6_9LACO|nr:DNA-3-methyladenine glycosylase [Liquorilactobacillus nagelii]AUJ32891.1 hypothetical protein BSQ50_10290 [Liquorilactobacillus nagelii]MCC7616362.1 DNA-3-methyladenine glycosylase [Liquorilactobacillus nagelii]MCP9315122.1 DNA-3-methyladenine glycosylase 2 family protein [Liquorilactobacillus nagelii]
MTANSFEIKVPQIFSWQAILGYLKRETNEVMFQVTEQDRVRRAFKVGTQIYLCEIAYLPETGQLKVTVLNGLTLNKTATELIGVFISEWFDLDEDLSSFYQMAASDELLAPLTKRFNGLRLVGMPDFYEAITWGILGQQINLGYTYTLKRRFTEKYGEKIVYEGMNYWIYPTADQVVPASLEELRELHLTQRKAEYLSDISQQITAGKISKEYYQEMFNAAIAEKTMIKLRGIGPWTANYVLMRCLRKGDAFPMADIGLLNGIKTIEKLDAKPPVEELQRLKKKWCKWCSYATFYIWRLLY